MTSCQLQFRLGIFSLGSCAFRKIFTCLKSQLGKLIKKMIIPNSFTDKIPGIVGLGFWEERLRKGKRGEDSV
jgi:hypothetical protein